MRLLRHRFFCFSVSVKQMNFLMFFFFGGGGVGGQKVSLFLLNQHLHFFKMTNWTS